MRKCPKIEAVNAVVTLVSSLRMRSFSRTEFLTTCVCAGQINTQQLLGSGGGIAPCPFLSIYFRYDTYFIKDKHTFFLFFIIFGVREAASYLNFLGNISIDSELPVSISKEQFLQPL